MMDEFRTMFDLLVNRICYEMLTGWRNVFFWLCARGSKGGVEDMDIYTHKRAFAKLLHGLSLV